ncbi:MAG: flagellar protein FlgN [Proteobacteria bacterium]|nr:flagellar protein FlgN [Pseudomonadota bacterium]MBU1581175.1 flagellar protein FlgN [Pseudomonadota bacterium]MBU2454582.1 flagellar protein FlgN [Pseudomonadota bacterium]MBU2629856.1 flagellar protein FlgN [Pseudomonadota bacterium]
MENFTSDIEYLLDEKLALYKQLNVLLKEERKFIVTMDVDSLWKSSDKKRKIVQKIQALREKILYQLEDKFGVNDMDIRSFSVSYLIRTIPISKELKTKFRQIKLALEKEKDELTQTAFDNKKYVTQYLGVIDDIMSVVVDNSRQAHYNHSGVMPNTKTSNCLIHAEV